MQKITLFNVLRFVADEGMILTNGETYGKVVFPATDDSPDNWYEITEEEYAARTETDTEGAATEADYQDALREMGVKV